MSLRVAIVCVLPSLPVVLQEHLQKLKPEDLARLHPRVSERMARESDEIRNRLEEARRMNMDELRELQRWAQLWRGEEGGGREGVWRERRVEDSDVKCCGDLA